MVLLIEEDEFAMALLLNSWVEALGPKGFVERFTEGVVGWLSSRREVDLNVVSVGPQVHQLTGELCSLPT
jgi:hypothetical protein